MATSYKVYHSTGTTPPVEPSYTTTGLSATITGLVNETYYVWVQAVNAGGSSPLSTYATKNLVLPAPATPVLTAGDGSITVTWTAVDMATSYKVYHGTDTTPPTTPSYTGTGLSTTITGLILDTPYYVWVQAVNAGGGSLLSTYATKTLSLSAPAAPVLTAINGSLLVTWTAVDLATSYKVYHGAGTTPPAEPSYTGTVRSTILTGLVNETPYYVWVQAVNMGGESSLSGWTTGTPTSNFTANTTAAFQNAVSAINSDTANGTYRITITGNFAASGISFTANAGKIITLEGDSAVRTIANGNTSAPLFILPSGIELILDNNITLDGTGKSYPVVRIDAGGTLAMDSGAKISGAKVSGVRIEGGVFTMTDGEISGNSTTPSSSSSYGGGVYVASGSFTMSGGTISGNSVSSESYYTGSMHYPSAYGGGVYVASGSFTMNGGTISGNSAFAEGSVYGGGVYIAGGSFAMSGGTISGNSATSAFSSYESLGGGVFVATSGIFTKTGGTITDTNVAANSSSSTGFGRVAFAANGSKKRETEAGPTVNLSSASATNWQ
jgi:hypothetical protein